MIGQEPEKVPDNPTGVTEKVLGTVVWGDKSGNGEDSAPRSDGTISINVQASDDKAAALLPVRCSRLSLWTVIQAG